MRCEGADNPPCRRCRHAGLECLFEKPSREPTLTGEAGLEYVSHAPISTTTDIYCSLSARRIKAIEASVADLRQTQIAIHQSLSELVQQLRTGSLNHGPNNVPPFRPSPGAYAGGSFSLSTSACTTPTGVDASSDLRHAVHSADGSGTYQGQNVLPPMMSNQQRQTPRPTAPSTAPYRSPSIGSGSRLSADTHPPHLPPPNGAYPTPTGMMYPPGPQGPMLPPISTFPDIGRQSSSANVSSVRYHSGDTSPRQHATKSGHNSGRRSPKRKAAGSSNVTSTNTSDYEDEENGELPSKGLVAPWEVLRGLAEVAAERAAHVSFLIFCYLDL